MANDDSGSGEESDQSEQSDNSSEEEEEEQEQSDFDDDLDGKKGSKKGAGKRPAGKAAAGKGASKRPKMSLFEEEADVDDDEEEEDEDEDEARYNRMNEEEISESERQIQARLEQRMKAGANFANTDAAELAAKLQARYTKQSRVSFAGAGGEGDAGVLQSRNAQLPTVQDPKLFCVKVKPGEERMLCIQLMNKVRALKAAGKPLAIFSVLHASSRGFIYVEARTQQQVSEAMYGMHGVFRSKISLVPLTEMPSVLRVVAQKPVLREGDYVRLRRFPYRGDLGRVHSLDDQAGKIVVKFVPRLDFALYSLSPEARKEHQAKKIVPPKRFFNADEVEAAGGQPQRRRPPWAAQETYDSVEEDFFLKGYMYKALNERMLQTKGVKPTLEELQAFRHGGRALGSDEEDDQDGALDDGNVLEQLGAASGDKAGGKGGKGGAQPGMSSLKVGDLVVVREGELQHLKGTVVSVDVTGTIKVDPLEESVRGSILDFAARDLMKLFHVGDHVKVLNGAYAGETGAVVKIVESSDKWRAIVFTDSSAKEVVAFLDDLQISAEIAQSRDSLKGFQMMDLVSLGQQVGVIVKVGTESVDLLLQTGNVRTVTVQEIRAKLNNKSRDTSAMDKARNTLSENSVVKVVAGENAGVEGTIKRIHRSFLFVHSRMRVANAGVFVERARNVQQAGVKLRNSAGFGVSMNKGGFSQSMTDAAGRGRGGPRFGNRDDSMLNKTVRIKSGRHKGYLGVAVEATDDVIKVELHAKKKKMEFPRDQVVVVGDKNGMRTHNQFGLPGQAGAGGPQPPFMQGGNAGTPGAYAPHGSSMGMGGGSHGHAGGSLYNAPSTPTNAPGTPGAADETGAGEAWNPNFGAGGAPGTPSGAPGTPGRDDSWGGGGGAQGGYKPPPTPASIFAQPSAGGYGGATPAALVPQTPATPAVPATPAAAGMHDDLPGRGGGLASGDTVKVVRGPNSGSSGVLQGVDGNDAIVKLKTGIVIVPKDSITRF